MDTERLPLRGTEFGDPTVLALDDMDSRAERRHGELTTAFVRIVGGLAAALVVVSLAAVFVVGESRGVDSGEVADAIVESLSARANP